MGCLNVLDGSLMINEIKKYGIKGCIETIWRYKIGAKASKVFKLIFSGLDLKNIIIFESMNDFDMNSGMIYQYLLKKEYNKKYKIVWFVKNRIPKGLPQNVIAVRIRNFNICLEYYNNIAKYIFYDNYRIAKKKEGQTVIYCGHATRAMKNCRGMISVSDDVDYAISASSFNDTLMSDIYGIDVNKFIETGMPCTDILLSKKSNYLEFHGGGRKAIIWLPTFRQSKQSRWRNDSTLESSTGLPLIETKENYKILDNELKRKNIMLIIKLHPSQDIKEIHIKETDNIKLFFPDTIKEMGIDTYDLLREADALISDYSSVSFDYLLMDRPIAYVLSDYEEYKLGFAVDNPKDFMPGDYIYDMDDLLAFIARVSNGEDIHRKERNILCKKIHKYRDGKSCERIVKFLNL